MSSKEKVSWGIIGAGRIAETFARDIKVVTNAELVAVASRDATNAEGFAERHHATVAYGSYDALFDDKQIDAVYIATPHNFHLQHCLAAMCAGKAVLCEKPITICAEECRQLQELNQNTGSYLMEGIWTWFLPAIRKARQWVTEGRIGAIKHIKADFGYPLPYSPNLREYNAQLAGGSLLEMGVYPVALTELFIGEEPQTVHAIARKAPNGVVDDLVFTFDFEDSVATLAASFRCKLQNWAYIIGERGYIAIPDFWRADQCSLYILDEIVDHFDDKRKTLGFDYEIAEASADIIAGKTQNETLPLDKSLKIQSLMDQVRIKANSACND